MNIAVGNYVVNNITNDPIGYIEQEKYFSLFDDYDINKLHYIFNTYKLIPVLKFFRLDDYENILEDISTDFINGSLSVTYQSGQRRTLSVTLLNTENKYIPHDRSEIIYRGCKFRLDLGILINNILYWYPQGIFVLNDPSQTEDDSNTQITLNLKDKFSLFDGSTNGNTSLKTIVPVGVPLRQVFMNILSFDNGTGRAFDSKPLIFESIQSNTLTEKTYNEAAGNTYGDVLTTYADMISSDIYYNVNGNLTITSNVNEFLTNNVAVIWRVDNNDRLLYKSTMNYNWSKLKNKVVVKGAISNGYQFGATAENTNPLSPFYVGNSKFGVNTEVVSNDKLYSDLLCKEQAMYVLMQKQRGVKTLNLNMGYMPFLDVNKSILITLDDYKITEKCFVIDSFNIELNGSPATNITLSNIDELIFA